MSTVTWPAPRVDDAANVAVEVHIADADARGLALDRVGDVVARRVGEQPLTVVRVVVEADLGVEGDDPPVGRHRERVDLEQRAVQLAEERQHLAQRLVEGRHGPAAQAKAAVSVRAWKGQIPRPA